MERWARQKNIERLERALAEEPDLERRRVICDILRGERARLDEIERSEAEARRRR
ncbi:MAG: hypothetical protein KGO51_09490 [Alphaproteobacteria bacterium]|nr:hypothetical protein [Alphaproteobacteria bacterium]